MKPLVIIGAGGLAQEYAWVAEEMNARLDADERWEILGSADDDTRRHGQDVYGYRVLGAPGPALAGGRPGPIWFCCAIGGNRDREAVVERVAAFGWRAATLIHPSVIMAKFVEIGEGTYVGPGSILNPHVRVGRHVLINERVAVGHDAALGDYSQACPGAQINGFCKVGRGAMLGSNASIHQGKEVGDFAVVGANSQVIRAVPPGASVCGVPARLFIKAAVTQTGNNKREQRS